MISDRIHINMESVSRFIGFILIMLFVGWACGGIYNAIFLDYSKPWFKGAKIEKVCEVDVDSNDNCYYLTVESDGKNIFAIYFSNGGYKYGSSDCAESASFYSYKRFCKFFTTNKEGRLERYDIIPTDKEEQR